MGEAVAQGASLPSSSATTASTTMPRQAGISWSGSPDDIPATAPGYGKLPDGGKRILLACAMMEDEVRCAYDMYGNGMEVRWIDRGYHEDPNVLRDKLQEMIDAAEADGATEILLAIGLCGNGVVGLKAQHAVLAMPRFDDCVNIMLCVGERTCRGLAKAGVMYLTRGWAHDATLITGQRELYARKYGERKADRLMKAMFGAYKAVSLIDNGCYELDDVHEYARVCADALGVGMQTDPGSNDVMEKLLFGQWDDDILVCEPGRAIAQEDFDFSAPEGCPCVDGRRLDGDSCPTAHDHPDNGFFDAYAPIAK